MFSTTLPLLPHMMAHASSADAPFDSEVSNADLDSEVSATTPSATPSSTTTASTSTSTSTREELQQLVMLSQLMDSASTASLSSNLNLSLSSDPSIIAMTSSSSSSSSDWSTSPSISPMVLKLESPVMTHMPEPSNASTKTSKARRASSNAAATSTESSSAASSNSSSRKRSAADPMDKDAKARERVLRNRAAAQESRDKKRKYVAEIEASNETLQEENCQLLKRLKTVESDNRSLSQRLETLTAQFSLMQQQLAMTMSMTGVVSTNNDNDIKKNNHNDENTINNQPGVGFCQSAVLAKKAKSNILTNSPQQKLTPSKGNFHTTTSNSNKHRRVYSMTTMTSMSKTKSLNREARLSSQSATRNRMETSCRPFCNNSRKRTLTLSSSPVASSPTAGTRPLALFMMVFLTNMLPQLMLNFSTLFLISTGAQSSNPQAPLPTQEQRLQQLAQFFIQQRQLFSSRLSNPQPDILRRSLQAQLGSIKNTISSLNSSVVEEIVTEFRQGRKDVARGLLVRALLSSPKALDNDSIKGLFLFRKD
ncbi:hypothetical protein EMPS_10504 [Entomortierella parvispora]|uniref:BZIP domain-containing protein n=1 Tax=Entomortierella parvispora TaxID=205924 RepID=A0A9P3M1L4_9FUNG|nr:hypothetical protein EMPS_10504 [Entomortierella parvispora]